MAASGKQPSSQSTGVASSTWGTEELSDANKRLRSELLECRRSLSRVQRELIATEKRSTEREQRKAAILLKDQRCKLHAEKQRDMGLQKDALQRKFDAEMGKLAKHKDADISKLRTDVKRYQDQLEEMTSQKLSTQKSGLSGSARGAFERENSRLVQEVQELRDNKRLLESQLQTAIHSDKQKTYLLKRAREKFQIQVNKVRKEGQIEIKKLLDQLKAKDRQIAQYEGEKTYLSPVPPWVTSTVQPITTELTSVKSITVPTRSPATKPTKIPGYQYKTLGNQEDKIPIDTKGTVVITQQEKPETVLEQLKVPKESAEVNSDLEEDSGLDSELSELSELGSSLGTSLAGSFTQDHQEPNPSIIQDEQSMSNSLSKLVEQLREQVSSLTHEKHDLESRLEDLEGRHRPLLEKTKKYVEENMELTKTNRQLDTLVKQNDIKNKKLQKQLETASQQESELQEKVEVGKSKKKKVPTATLR